MIKGYVNLMAFTNAFIEVREATNGEKIKCLTIPLPTNHLDQHEKGGVFVNWTAWENEKTKGDYTHLINHDPGKDIRDQLKDLGKYPATLGALREGNAVAQTGAVEPETMPQAGKGEKLPF